MKKFTQSLHEGSYQKIINRFCKYIAINLIPDILNEEDIDLVIDEIVNDRDLGKSETEIETCESIEELKKPQEFEDGFIIVLDDLNEKEMNDSRIQAMFERSKHNNLSFFISSQDYSELPKPTIRANGNICHIFKPNNFRDVQNLDQDKSNMDMTPYEFKILTSTCLKEIYQPLTIDMTKDKYTGR